MTDMHTEHTNGVSNATPPPEFVRSETCSMGRISITTVSWNATSEISRLIVNRRADQLGTVFAFGPTRETVQTDELVTDGATMEILAALLKTHGIPFDIVATVVGTDGRTPSAVAAEERAGEVLGIPPGDIHTAVNASLAGDPTLESRILIGRQSWLRVKEKTAAKVMAADRDCNVGLSTTPTGAMMTNAFPKGDVRIVAFASALEGLKVAFTVHDLPPGGEVVEPVEEPATPRGSARKARRAEGSDEEETDPSLDLAIAHVTAEDFAAALKIVLKAAPKVGSPGFARVVLASDPLKRRLELAAHDGTRYHIAFVPTSDAVEMAPQAIQLRSARSLLKSAEFAVKERKAAARIGFAEHTGNPTRLVISCGKPQPLTFELKLASKGEPEGWRPPKFSRSGDANAGQYDARAITEATSWKGARVTRDECDGVGRRHITLTDQASVELMRAVIMPEGITEGLPEDPQLEIDGALSPKKPKRGKKAEQLPLATGPAVKRSAPKSWLLESSVDGKKYSTETSGTEAEVTDALKSLNRRKPELHLRTVAPDGLVAKVRDGKAVAMTAAEKRIAKPAAKKPAKKLDTNVTARRPAKPAKKSRRK